MALKGKVYWKHSNNQQGIPYIPAPNLEGMLCKIKSIKISILFFFHFRIFFLVLQIQLLTIKVNLKSKEYKTSSWNQIACFFYCYLPIFWCISTGSQCIFRIPLTCHLQNKNTQEMCQDYHKKSWHTSFFTVIFRLPCVFYGPYYRD